MKKLAVFDLDGTLFDTKDVNFSAYSKVLEELGYKERIDYKYYCDYCNDSWFNERKLDANLASGLWVKCKNNN